MAQNLVNDQVEILIPGLETQVHEEWAPFGMFQTYDVSHSPERRLCRIDRLRKIAYGLGAARDHAKRRTIHATKLRGSLDKVQQSTAIALGQVRRSVRVGSVCRERKEQYSIQWLTSRDHGVQHSADVLRPIEVQRKLISTRMIEGRCLQTHGAKRTALM